VAPALLHEMLEGVRSGDQQGGESPELLVGNHTGDDAAAYQLANGMVLISTTDFFTPIVDDPYVFGQIAAANALSDVWAMGGKPMLALNILGWPTETLSAKDAGEVLRGGAEVCRRAGVAVGGGHSIDSPEPFYGLGVNGSCEISSLKRNNTAQAGDLLLLTKPIGSGTLSAAYKRGVIDEAHVTLWIENMIKLNDLGQYLGNMKGVTALTDVTGFGLLGHLHEMAVGSGLTANLEFGKVPILEAARIYAAKGITPDATFRNWNAYSKDTAIEQTVPMMEAFNLLPDPQTNGGLLIAVRPDALAPLQELLRAHALEGFAEPIGWFSDYADKRIIVR
jgi:selenide,water dikinase